jgi:hypothetical protein
MRAEDRITAMRLNAHAIFTLTQLRNFGTDYEKVFYTYNDSSKFQISLTHLNSSSILEKLKDLDHVDPNA